MRVPGLLAATCLAGTLCVPLAALCAPTPGSGHGTILVNSDQPVRPGIKIGDASGGPSAYGDEPGTGNAARGGRRDNTSSAGPASPQRETPAPRAHLSAQSAVLDTLGNVQGDSTAGDSQNLGLKLRPLTAAERETYGVQDGGLVVTSVTDGLGQRAGFRPGDVVLMLNGVDVTSSAQFCKLMQSLPHDHPVPVLVRRPGSNLFLPLGVPSRP